MAKKGEIQNKLDIKKKPLVVERRGRRKNVHDRKSLRLERHIRRAFISMIGRKHCIREWDGRRLWVGIPPAAPKRRRATKEKKL